MPRREDNFNQRINRAHTRLAVLERLTWLEWSAIGTGERQTLGFPSEYHMGLYEMVRDIMFDIRPYVDWSPDDEPSAKWVRECIDEALANERKEMFGYDIDETESVLDRLKRERRESKARENATHKEVTS